MTVALITGGTRGIGFAVAKRLAGRGYDLILTYHSNEEAAGRAECELRALGAESVAILALDTSKEESVSRLSAYLRERGTAVDVLVLNAGITKREPFGQISQKSWMEVFQANVHFPTLLIQDLAGDVLVPGSSIVFTGSLLGIRPHGTVLSYGVTKAAVHALVENLVKFLSPLSIRVNAVAPGFVDTDWQRNKPAEIRASIESKTALGRFSTPDEISDAFVFAIDSKYLNGEIIKIDGGYDFR